MKKLSRILILFSFIAAANVLAAESQPTILIEDPNGSGNADVTHIAASEASDSGRRLLVWVDGTTDHVFAQVLDAATNLPEPGLGRMQMDEVGFTQFVNGTPLTYNLRYDAFNQPAIASRSGADEWLVTWVAKIGYRSLGSEISIVWSLVGRRVWISEESGSPQVNLGQLRHHAARVFTEDRDGNGITEPYFFEALSSANDEYSLRHDPESDHYLLVWSGKKDIDHHEDHHEISACRIAAGNDSVTCPNEPLAEFSGYTARTVSGSQLDIALNMDEEGRAALTYTDSSVGSLRHVYIKLFDTDLSDLDAIPVEVAGVASLAPSLYRDQVRDSVFILGKSYAPFEPVRLSVLSGSMASFPSAMTRSELFQDLTNEADIVQPRTRYFADADIYMFFWEDSIDGDEFDGLYWGAVDMDSMTSSREAVTGFLVLDRDDFEFYKRRDRSVLLQNPQDDTRLSIIGRDADSAAIVGMHFTPYRVDHSITVNAVDAPYLHGENAVFHVTLDNRTPEGGLAKLAVAHDIALRLNFNSSDITPIISDGICSSFALNGEDWLCRLASPMVADEILEFDVTVDTTALSNIPIEGMTLTLTGSSGTISNDPVVEDNTAAVGFTVLPTADLVLSIADGGIGIVGGESFTLDFTISNQGESQAAGVTFKLTVPEGMTVESATGCTPTVTSGELNCVDVANVDAGGNTAISITLATEAVSSETTEQLAALVLSATADVDDINNSLPINVSRVPVGADPVDPVDRNDPVDPNDPNDPADPNDPNDPNDPTPPSSGGGGGGAFSLGLLPLLLMARRRIAAR